MLLVSIPQKGLVILQVYGSCDPMNHTLSFNPSEGISHPARGFLKVGLFDLARFNPSKGISHPASRL